MIDFANSKQNIVLGISYCPHCIAAVRSLIQQGISFYFINIEEEKDTYKRKVAENSGVSPNMVTFPQIFSAGELIGGNDDLRAFLQDNKNTDSLRKVGHDNDQDLCVLKDEADSHAADVAVRKMRNPKTRFVVTHKKNTK